jgi:hypothetical protein
LLKLRLTVPISEMSLLTGTPNYSHYDLEISELSKIGERDTVLNGINYKQILKEGFFDYYCFGIREEVETGSLFINRDGASEVLVSTMDLNEGDKFYFPANAYFDNFYFYFEEIRNDENGNYTLVDSVYYKDSRKHIRFEAHYFPFGYDIPLMFIEGIGPNISFNFFIDNTNFSVCFLCYETERELWKNMYLKYKGAEEPHLLHEGECLFNYVSIPVVKENFPFKLIQQKEKVEIQFTGVALKHGTASIYSIDGRLLASKIFRDNLSVAFSISGFSEDIYIIYIKDTETGRSWSKTLLN